MAGNANIKIGPVRLTVDPDNISIVDSKVNTIVPGLRNDAPRAISTGSSNIGIRMAVIFPDVKDVNQKFRSIIAYFRATPFLNIQSDVINRMVSTRLTQRVANLNRPDAPAGMSRKDFLFQQFRTNLIQLIANSLLEDAVVSYLGWAGKSVHEEIGKYLDGRIQLNANWPQETSFIKVRQLNLSYVDINYKVADDSIPIKPAAGTSSEQIDRLIKVLHSRMADKGQVSHTEVTTAINQGIRQLITSTDVQDGDTIIVTGREQRIFGVDAFETLRPGTVSSPGQGRTGGREHEFAVLARQRLIAFLFDGVTPKQFQLTNRGLDFYNRDLSSVTLLSPDPGYSPDVAMELILEGIALPSAISNGGDYANPADLPYVYAMLRAAGEEDPRTGTRGDPQGMWRSDWGNDDIQIPSLWRKLANNINNFVSLDPDSLLRPELIPSTLVKKSDLIKLAKAIIKREEPGLVTREEEYSYRADQLVDAYKNGLAALEANPAAFKQGAIEFSGFPNDMVPVVFSGITYASVAEMPDAIQAEFNFSVFNHYPYTPALTFITTPTDINISPSDSDASFAGPLNRYVDDLYTGFHSAVSSERVQKYVPGDNRLFFNYKDVVLRPFLRGYAKQMTPGMGPAIFPALKEQLTAQKQLDIIYKPVFVDKQFILDPGTSEPFKVDSPAEEYSSTPTIVTIGDVDIESVTVNINNNIVSIPLEGIPLPTAQHVGKGGSTVVIEFSTTNSDTVAAFRSIDATIQMAASIAYQYRTPTSFTVSNSILGLSGISNFIFDNIIITSDSEVPGKTNIKIILLESTRTDEDMQQRLIPQFEVSPANTEKSIKAITDLVRKLPQHNLVGDLLETFLPINETRRNLAFPLALIFAHTRQDKTDFSGSILTASVMGTDITSKYRGRGSEWGVPEMVPRAKSKNYDWYGYNQQLRDDFLKLSPDLKVYDSVLAIDLIWVAHERKAITQLNFRYKQGQLDEKVHTSNLVGPWGPGKGDILGTADSIPDRYASYVLGAGANYPRNMILSISRYISPDTSYSQDVEYNKALGQSCYVLNQRIRRAFANKVIAPDAMADLLFYMFKEAALSRTFANFFGTWLVKASDWYPGLLGAELLPPSNEPITYRDLKLPTYRQVYGQKEGMLTRKRDNLYSRIRAIPGAFEYEGTLQVVKDASPQAFYANVQDVLSKINKEPNNTAADFSSKYNEALFLLETLHTEETGLYNPVVPDKVLPTYQQLGIRPVNGRFKIDIARSADDVVEAGWMYGLGYTDRFLNFSKTFDINNIKDMVLGKGVRLSTKTYPAAPAGKNPEDEEAPDAADAVLKSLPDSNKPSVIDKALAGIGAKKEDQLGSNVQVLLSDASKRAEARNRSFLESKSPHLKPEEVFAIAEPAVPEGVSKKTSKRSSRFQYKSPTRAATLDANLDNQGYLQAKVDAMDRGMILSSMRKAYPSYAIYFLQEDSEDWGYLDDYYRYDAVISWDVMMSKDAPDVATIRFINHKGILSNTNEEYNTGSEVKGNDATVTRTPQTVDLTHGNGMAGKPGVLDEGAVTAFKLRPGTRIVIKAGYTSKAEEMEVLFTGQVAEVMPGDITSVVCQSYMSQLMGYMDTTFYRSEENFPEIVHLMLHDTTYFGRWELYVNRWEGQNKKINASMLEKFFDTLTSIFKGKDYQDIVPDTSDDNIYIRNEPSNAFSWTWNWFANNPWKVKGPVWENLLTMPRFIPNTVVAVRPYDARATLFFGSPDSNYIFTNRLPLKPGWLQAALVQHVLDGNAQDAKAGKRDLINRLTQGNVPIEDGKYLGNIDYVSLTDEFYGNSSAKDFKAALANIDDETLQLAFSLWASDKYKITFYPYVPEEEERAIPSGSVALDYEDKNILLQYITGAIGQRMNGYSNVRTYVFKGVLRNTSLVPSMGTYFLGDSLPIPVPQKDSEHGSILRSRLILNPHVSSTLLIQAVNFYQGLPGDQKSKQSQLKAFIRSQRGPGNRLSAGYIVIQTESQFISAYQITMTATADFMAQFMTEFLPWIYRIKKWLNDNPESFLAQAIKNSAKLNDYQMPPNERPFRMYHHALQGFNIIKNDIVASMAQSANSVSLVNETGKGTMPIPVTESLMNKYHATIKDINCHKIESVQATMSALGEVLRNMYRGQLVLLGDETIKPHDLVRIDDHYNIMYGAIEVDRVVHSFNSESGFTSTITPHLLVRVEEDRGWWEAVIANIVGGAKNLGILTGAVGVGAGLTFFLGGPFGFLIGGGIGLTLGMWGAWKFTDPAGISGLDEDTLLGIPFPSFSSQGRFDKSRQNPVRIQPLVYRGSPYVVGLEGWSRNTWTIAEAKAYRWEKVWANWDQLKLEAATEVQRLGEIPNAIFDILMGTGEAFFMRRNYKVDQTSMQITTKAK